jgi:hypothetical protein
MEASHDLQKTDLLFEMLPNGHETISIRDTLTKNHRDGQNSLSTNAKIYSTNDQNCPIQLLKRYLSKLHPVCPFLWQRVLNSYGDDDPIWYANVKIGINTISQFMRKISEFYKLRRTYTNHCVRATAITHLGKSFQDTEILEISGHKSISCLGIYKKTSENVIQNMSDSLHTLISSQGCSRAVI